MDGNITSCTGFLVDSGLTSGEYSTDETATITICPEAPEEIINLDFFIFNLGTGDTMTIYDGNSTNSPLIGIFSGSELQGNNVTSTNGCLTILWESDDVDNGNFSIELTCGIPCIAPIVFIETDQGIPTLGCPNDEITFDGSLTEFFNGGIEGTFTWDFGDGTTDSESWPQVSHTYSEPGGYVVELYMTDSNGCESTNFVSFVVLIATEPNIDIEFESPICLGSEASYQVDANYTPVTWTQISGGITGGYLYIPDNTGQQLSSSVNLTGFNPLDVIDEVSDFEHFFVNMEHSFMGDLTILFECPNGQTIVVHEPGGGGTYLGDPIDNDASETNPGTGWDYWWSPSATNGTWLTESNNYTTLPSGTYQSQAPWSNLIGCPLNGVWTIIVTDTWGIDNGFVFDWSLEFDPSLYPDLINFTPEIGDGPDSTFWNIDPTITNITDDGNGLTLLFNEPGLYEYTYTLIDNFGCTYDENYEIEVIQGPIADAGEDIFLCNEDGNLEAQVIPGNTPFNSAIYEWTPYDNLSDATMNLDPAVTGLDTTTTYVFSVFPVGNPQCISYDSVLVTVQDLPNPGIDTEIIYCPTDDEINLFTEIDGNPDGDGVWLDQNNTLVDSLFNPSTDENVVYYYSFPNCGINSEITVIVNHLDFSISTDTTICQNGIAELHIELLNPFIGSADYIWNQGLPNSDYVIVSPEEPTVYTAHIEYGNGCYTESESTTIFYYPPLNLEINNNTTICNGAEILLEIMTASGGIEPYTYNWTGSQDTTISVNPSVIQTLEENTTYCLTLTDQCESSPVTNCTEITIEQLVTADFEIENNSGCYPINTILTPNETNFENILEEIWNYGDGNQLTQSTGSTVHQYTTPGEYSVTHTLVTNTGCFYTSSQPNSIHVFPRPLASFSVDNEVQVLPYTTFNYINQSVGNEYNYWNFYSSSNLELGNSTEEHPSYTYPPMQLDDYLATLFVENEYGCIDSTSRKVEVLEDFLLFAPTAITANNDGVNDFFYVKGIDIDPDNFLIQIYDRWGIIVFETNDLNKGWNGVLTTNKQRNIEGAQSGSNYYTQNDTYIYRIETKSLSSGNKKIISGYLTVIR